MCIQPFTTVLDWPEIGCLIEVYTMFYICRYCVSTWDGRDDKPVSRRLNMRWISSRTIQVITSAAIGPNWPEPTTLCCLLIEYSKSLTIRPIVPFRRSVRYPKRYPKCDTRNIDMRNPKHFVFLTYKHNCTASFDIRKKFSWNFDMCFGYPKGLLDMLWHLALFVERVMLLNSYKHFWY